MNAKKLFERDLFGSGLTSFIFCFGSVFCFYWTLGEDGAFLVDWFFYVWIIHFIFCLAVFFLFVGGYELSEDGDFKKFWDMALLKNIIEAAEFLLVIFGMYFFLEKCDTLSDEVLADFYTFCLLVFGPRLIQFVATAYCLIRYYPTGKGSSSQNPSSFEFHFSQDGKCAYGNLRRND